MPVKPEVISEFFGYDPEKFENDDSFREVAGRDWTKTAEAAKHPDVMTAVTGRMNGVIAGKLKQAFKGLDLQTDGIDWDKMAPADVIPVLVERASKTWQEKEGKLTESLKGKGSEEARKEYERQLAEYEKKTKEYETANGTLRGEIDGMKKAEAERELNGKINTQWEVARNGLKFKQGMSDLEKAGFDMEAKKRFQVRFDEKGEPYWAGQDGNRIQDGTKHQAWKDGSQLLKELAKELKVEETNVHGGKPVGQQRNQPNTPPEVKPIRNRIIAQPGLGMS